MDLLFYSVHKQQSSCWPGTLTLIITDLEETVNDLIPSLNKSYRLRAEALSDCLVPQSHTAQCHQLQTQSQYLFPRSNGRFACISADGGFSSSKTEPSLPEKNSAPLLTALHKTAFKNELKASCVLIYKQIGQIRTQLFCVYACVCVCARAQDQKSALPVLFYHSLP